MIRRLIWSLHPRTVPIFNNLLIKRNKKNYNDETLDKDIFELVSHSLKKKKKNKC